MDVGSDPKKQVGAWVKISWGGGCVHVYWAEVMCACVCAAV